MDNSLIARAKLRQRVMLLANCAFFWFVLWLVHDLAWYWSVLPSAYVTLNLICGLFRYAVTMRALNSPIARIYEYIEVLKTVCDEAAANAPDPVYDENDRCRNCSRLRKRPHLEHCSHNEFWK